METEARFAALARPPVGATAGAIAGPPEGGGDDDGEGEGFKSPPNGTLAQQLRLRRGSLRATPELPPRPLLSMNDESGHSDAEVPCRE